jgi:hypothetical protein
MKKVRASTVVPNFILKNGFFAALAIASFECEPPENSFEKERYKNLK